MSDEPPRARNGPPKRLRKRAEFLRVAQGSRVHLSGFTLQAAGRAPTGPTDGGEPRVGFTVTKKVGGAVERNRIRRRLREALRHAKALPTARDTDYVVVARREVLGLPFERLIVDLQTAVRKVGDAMTRQGLSGRTGRGRGKT